MTTRILPLEEWDRLEQTGSAGMHLDPANAVVIVVEDDQKEIVGCWAMLRVIHAEGFWIAESHRKRGAVLRRLLREMRHVVTQFFGVNAAWTAAMDQEVATLVKSYGGVKLPGEHYVFPVAGV